MLQDSVNLTEQELLESDLLDAVECELVRIAEQLIDQLGYDPSEYED